MADDPSSQTLTPIAFGERPRILRTGRGTWPS
jgi:hypothetical protein